MVTSSGLYADEDEWVGCSVDEASKLDRQDLFASAVEDLVGAHAQEGIDVTADAYRRGIEKAVEHMLSEVYGD